MPMQAVISETKTKMQKALQVLQDELKAFRGGRATPALVEHVRVDYYGSPTPLKSLATISAPEADMLVIKPFDPSTLKDIERAIEKSEIGINPQNDGKIIRLPVPPLSTERRGQLAAQVKQLAEHQKVAVRNARRDANKALSAAEKTKELTEDDVKSGEKQVQELTDNYCKQIDRLLDEKSKDIMEV